MKLIKRQILLNSGDSINMKIPLTQTIDNIGLMTDMPFMEGSQIDLCSGGLPLDFMNDGLTSTFYKQGGIVNYGSDSKLEVVRTYDDDNKYVVNFDTKRESYTNFNGTSINGVDRVININGNQITYVVNARRDSLIGTPNQITGIKYIDNPQEGVTIPRELDVDSTTTKVQYYAEGWNETNTSTDPQIQEEYLLGIISQPEVKTDVFIDRTTFSVLDRHLRLSEIKSLDHLTKYGNGFYNINRD
jgi:hypothetical protein|tara:strand:+ start:2387 stop:3118 length:732 start_codon:yes stop_codon:yes gene_type:complete